MHFYILFILDATSSSVSVFLLLQHYSCCSVVNLGVIFDVYTCLLHWCSRVLEGAFCFSERCVSVTNECRCKC
jgi:hypothetical protein